MSASLAQVQEKMNMQAEQLEAAELQLVQQQARLTSQEAELHESETAFQERMTAHSQMHSRLNGASSGRFSLAVSICCFSYASGICCCSCLFVNCIHASKDCLFPVAISHLDCCTM